MPFDFGQLTSPSVPIAAAAGTTGPGLPQPNIAALSLPGFGSTPGEGLGAAAPSGAPPSAPPPAAPPQNDPLSGVMNHINSGETGSDPNAYGALYGGGHYGFPQWSGKEGPQGISHAAGKAQWEPATWDSAVKFWMSRNPGQPPPDFKNPGDQDKVQRLWAIKTYGVDTNGRTLSQAAKSGDVDYTRLAGQWPSLGHPGGASGYAQDKADIRAQESDINKKIGDLAEKIGSLDARDPASLKELAHYREEMEKYQQQALQIATHPPQFHPGQSMQQQGGMALIIGMLGGLLTKRPLIASLNAGAAAMNAYNKGDQQEYQRNLDQWKVSTDAMFKMAEFEHQMYADTLKDEKLSEGEKLDKIQAQASLLGNQRMLLASQSQNLDQAQHNTTSMENMLLKFQLERDKADKPQLFSDKQGNVIELHPLSDTATEAPLPQGATKVGGVSAAGGEWSKEAMDVLVTRAITTGDQSVLAQLPRSGPARKQFEETLAEKLKDQPGGIAGGVSGMVMNNLRMAEARSAATTAGRVTMNTQLYSAEAEGAAKLVVDASRLVPRTNLPAINVIEEAGLKHTGDPGIIQLGISINALLNAYGKMSNPTGTGIHDADKARLESVLTAALSQGQIEAGVDQVVKEGKNLATAAQQAQVAALAGIVPQTPGAPAPAAPAVAPAAGGGAHPNISKSDYDALPPGGKFWWDGQELTKGQ